MFLRIKTIKGIYLFFLDCLSLKIEALLYTETSGTTHPTERGGVSDDVTIDPFEKSERQGNVWQNTRKIMKAITRQDKQK
jgi:hypothetical protein